MARDFRMLPIEAELVKERASALRRVAGKLEASLEALAAVERQLEKGQGERAALLAEHERLRGEAERFRWYLIVQRDAIGVSRHDDVLALYPIPKRRR